MGAVGAIVGAVGASVGAVGDMVGPVGAPVGAVGASVGSAVGAVPRSETHFTYGRYARTCARPWPLPVNHDTSVCD